MLPSPAVRHIREFGAVAWTGRVALAGDFFPPGGLYRRETGIPARPRMHFGDLKAIGDIHPLFVDLGAPDDGILSDRTSQSIGMRHRPRRSEGRRHHRTRRAELRIARDDDV